MLQNKNIVQIAANTTKNPIEALSHWTEPNHNGFRILLRITWWKAFQLKNNAKEFLNLWKEKSGSLAEWAVLCTSARCDDSPRDSGFGRMRCTPGRQQPHPSSCEGKEFAENKENEADGWKGALGERDRWTGTGGAWRGDGQTARHQVASQSPVPVPPEAQPSPDTGSPDSPLCSHNNFHVSVSVHSSTFGYFKKEI